MELNDNIMQIIIRQLNGEATTDEQAVLESWLNESTERRQEMEAYMKLWKDSSDVAQQHQFNTTEAWQNIEKKIQRPLDAIPLKRNTVFTMKRLAAAAAIILFITIAAAYLFNTNEKDSWQTIAALQNNERVILPDSSVVTLRKGSTLRYQNSFGKEKRFLELNGEAYFEVQRNEQNPFRVTTADAIVEVLGTSFLVHTTDSSDRVVVTSGKVLFAEREKEANKVILTKGQEAKLVNGQLTQDTTVSTNFMSWQSGKLIFHNTPLKQVAEDISDYYQIAVKLDPEVQKDAGAITIKAEFDKEPLEQVLEEIELMTGLKITRENGVVRVRK